MIVLVFVLDFFIITPGIAWFASHQYNKRYLAARKLDKLGAKDVALLRDMAQVLTTLLAVDKMSPVGLPADVIEDAEDCLGRYLRTRETI